MTNVLLVDDNDALLFAFKKLSLSHPFSVETANSLDNALELLSHKQYDVLISDLNLTGDTSHEGYEIVKAAKKNNQLLRAYIWTAYDGKQVREDANKIGIEGFLTKPITFNALVSLINDPGSTKGTPVQ